MKGIYSLSKQICKSTLMLRRYVQAEGKGLMQKTFGKVMDWALQDGKLFQ